MTDRTTEVVAAPVAIATDQHSYVDWCAVFAGTVLASAISLIFIAFGSALGLTFVSPFAGEGASAVGMAIAAALWLIWVQVSSFLAGGYIAGRLRRRIGDATEHESDVRDGSHGLLAWALGVVVLAFFAAASIGATATGAAVAAGSHADTIAARSSYYVDRLLRPGEAPTPGEANPGDARTEIGRILAQGATGSHLSDEDRSYLARIVAARTGIPAAEAERRVETLVTDAKLAANKARKFGIVAAFLAAATLLVSALAAWFAAQWGGRHRDEGTIVPALGRWS
ncbi:MAG: hypothetical protein AB7S41_13755 [Parvibaculaceae bacterium]